MTQEIVSDILAQSCGSNLSAHSVTVTAHRPQIHNVEGAAHEGVLSPRASFILSTTQSRTIHSLAKNNIDGVVGNGVGAMEWAAREVDQADLRTCLPADAMPADAIPADAIGRSISLGSPSSAWRRLG